MPTADSAGARDATGPENDGQDASSAGFSCSSSSLRLGLGRRDPTQHRQHSVPAGTALGKDRQQSPRQPGRRETGDLCPETTPWLCRRKMLGPVPPPAQDRAPADRKLLLQAAKPLRAHPVAQNRYQQHQGAKEHLPAQEAHRAWGRATPAPLLGTAEALPDTATAIQAGWAASRLASISRTMQNPATPAASPTYRLRQIQVDAMKKIEEARVAQQILVQSPVSFRLRHRKKTPPSRRRQAPWRAPTARPSGRG